MSGRSRSLSSWPFLLPLPVAAGLRRRWFLGALLTGGLLGWVARADAARAASMALWGRQPGSGAKHIDISLMQAAAHIQALW